MNTVTSKTTGYTYDLSPVYFGDPSHDLFGYDIRHDGEPIAFIQWHLKDAAVARIETRDYSWALQHIPYPDIVLAIEITEHDPDYRRMPAR